MKTTITHVFDNDQELITFKSSPAVSLGIFDPDPKEMMCYLYLPIKLIDSSMQTLGPRVEEPKPFVINKV